MLTVAIVGLVAAYVVLAVLLLSLNFASLWRFWVKAGAIVLTTAMFVVSYLSIAGLIGWPSNTPLPPRFSLLHTRIVEPNKVQGTEGHIYLMVEEVDEHQQITTPPRLYEVPYSVELSSDVAEAQEQIDGGGKVLGEYGADNAKKSGKQADQLRTGSTQAKLGQSSQQGTTGNGGVSGDPDTVPDTPTVSFSDMPPVDLPEKSPIVVGQ